MRARGGGGDHATLLDDRGFLSLGRRLDRELCEGERRHRDRGRRRRRRRYGWAKRPRPGPWYVLVGSDGRVVLDDERHVLGSVEQQRFLEQRRVLVRRRRRRRYRRRQPLWRQRLSGRRDLYELSH